jgi:hypothetical protein
MSHKGISQGDVKLCESKLYSPTSCSCRDSEYSLQPTPVRSWQGLTQLYGSSMERATSATP